MTGYSCCGIPGGAIPIYILIQIGILAFVYYKAEEYGMDPVIWLIAIFFFGPLAFGVFLLLILFQSRGPRRPEREAVRHPMKYERKKNYLPLPTPSPIPDPDFYDERLERLIEEGKIYEAREYLRDMIQIAREMKDEASLRNYSRYEPKINKAAMDKTKKPEKY